ncbi:transcriptional regulator, partial [Enterobacter cloacae]
LVTSQLTEAKPEVALFVEWLDEEVAAWRQLTES